MEKWHPNVRLSSREPDGSVLQTTYGETALRIRKLANVLKELGVAPGDCVGTLAWNTHRHFELYFAISGIGAICHTINPRFGAERLVYVANDANDQVLFFDDTFDDMVAASRPHLTSVKHFVSLADRSQVPGAQFYERSVDAASPLRTWPEFDERMASGLCYSSGTTGSPKGVLYSHRSTLLHSLAIIAPDCLNISTAETILPVVPMFHVNAWGVPYAAAMAGARLVFPGRQPDPKTLYELMESEAVTMTLGVPTVWLDLLNFMDENGLTFSSLRRVISGGAALPEVVLRRFSDNHGVAVHHGWGMTEMSPVGVINVLRPEDAATDAEARIPVQLKQGRFPFGCDARLVDDDGNVLPHDGRAQGHLQVRGPWVIDRYFNADGPATTADGWFDTGDIATIDSGGYLKITDRDKDLIRSGGEWISSLDIENTAMKHPDIAQAAAIGKPHPKWGERPILIAVRRNGSQIDEATLRQYLMEKIEKWTVPDEIIFVDALPIGATGKIQKSALRDIYVK